MNTTLSAVIGLLVGGVIGFIFVSPLFIWMWIKKRNETKWWKEQLKKHPEFGKYKQVLPVWEADNHKASTWWKASNFTSKGVLLLDEDKAVYKDLSKNRTVTFEAESANLEWVGYMPSSGWVAWMKMKDAKGEVYYFAGQKTSWKGSKEVYEKITQSWGKVVEVQVQKKVETHLNQLNASWFYMIAVLSFVNTVLFVTHANVTFLVGLAMVQFLDGFFILGMGNVLAGLLASALVAAGIWKLGRDAKAGKRSAYKAGLTIIIIDSVLLLLFSLGGQEMPGSLIINVFFRALMIKAMVQGMTLLSDERVQV